MEVSISEMAGRIAGILRDAGAVLESVELGEGTHYAGTEKKPHGSDFRYWVMLDFPPSVTFRNYHDGGESMTVHLWDKAEIGRMSVVDRARIRQEIEKQKAEARQRHDAELLAAADKAAYLMKKSAPCRRHPYLRRKKVAPVPNLGIGRNGTLLVPMFDPAGRTASVQFIDRDGNKRFLRGGAKKGCYFPIHGNPSGPLLIAEGLATGISLFMSTGYSVVVAFDAGNLLPVGKVMRHRYPSRQIIFAADNDVESVDAKGQPFNTGVVKARAAADAVGGKVAIPPAIDGKSTDFNDLLVAGLTEVC
ncbi:MAG: toprim domain-containing protein [Mailhella sp.]|nr:toprim domain-containing protein [Mailhella sp.]